MMREMGGARGTGLGKSGQGVLEPMKAASNSTSGEGLGYGHKKTRTIPQLKVLTWYDEEDQECNEYGYEGTPLRDGTRTFNPARITPLGRPTSSDAPNQLTIGDSGVLRDVVYWGRSVIGTGEATYPHPKSWTFIGIPEAKSLDKITTSDLTIALTKTKEPSCMAAWETRINPPASTDTPPRPHRTCSSRATLRQDQTRAAHERHRIRSARCTTTQAALENDRREPQDPRIAHV